MQRSERRRCVFKEVKYKDVYVEVKGKEVQGKASECKCIA